MTDGSPACRNREIQGNVRLCVEGAYSPQMVISFLNTLSQKTCIRFLEIAGHAAEGVNIQLEIRKPMDFISALRQIEGVSKVETHQGEEEHDDEPRVYVQLAGMARAGIS